MDTRTIIDTLGLIDGGGISITDIQMVQWGRDLIFECVYRTAGMTTAPEAPVNFRIVFHDCREIKYKVYAHIGIHERGGVSPVADVVELNLGKGHHRRDANLLTNYFGVTLSYGEVKVEHDDETFTLPD